jgi:hypothetical protein
LVWRIAITLDIYSHAMPNMQADAAVMLDAAFKAIWTNRDQIASKMLANRQIMV